MESAENTLTAKKLEDYIIGSILIENSIAQEVVTLLDLMIFIMKLIVIL